MIVLASMVHAAGPVVSAWSLVPGEIVGGAGMGMILPPLFSFVLAGVTDHDVGSASGVLSAVQQFGSALGIAVFGTVFLADVHGRPASSAMAVAVILTLVPLAICFLAVFRLPSHPRDMQP
jgi:MFS family permease